MITRRSAADIIVVNDGSSDGTAAKLANYTAEGRLSVMTVPNGGPSRARNLAIARANGEYIAFTDSDCLAKNNWLEQLLYALKQFPEAAGAGGIQISPEDESEFGKKVNRFLFSVGFVADYMKRGGKITYTAHNPSCNSLYRREVLVKAGLFDETLWPGEDVDLDHRIKLLGYKQIFNPGAQVFHYRPQSYAVFSKMMERYGYVQAKLVKKHGIFRFLHIEPILLLLSLLACVYLSLSNPLYVLMLLLSLVIIIELYFYFRSGAFYLLLLMRTLFSWNLGFARGIMSK